MAGKPASQQQGWCAAVVTNAYVWAQTRTWDTRHTSEAVPGTALLTAVGTGTKFKLVRMTNKCHCPTQRFWSKLTHVVALVSVHLD